MTGPNPDRHKDAFKARMAAAQAETGRPELAFQSLGRALTDREHAFADALMEIYAAGANTPADIASALTQRKVAVPSSGVADWTAEALETELKSLNADLDAAYAENGFGA